MEKIIFYGTRGTTSLSSDKYNEFGGATSCILINLGGENIFVDCGSGINNAFEQIAKLDEINLLITHTHLDHVSGIPALLSSFPNKRINIYGKTFDGVSVKDSINDIMKKSLWPVSIDSYKNLVFNEIRGDLRIGDVNITNMDSNHPGGCSLFRFDYQNDSIVTALDFSHLDGYEDKLVEFAKNATCLIYDGCMNEEELKVHPDWGHSTPEVGAKIGDLIGCNEIIITHFGNFDDETLTKWEEEIKAKYPHVRFARSGQSRNDLQKMIEVGNLLSQEKDNDVLLTKIVKSCMDITHADGGTLYIVNNDKLDFKVLINKSKNVNLIKKDESLNIPAVDINGKNACAACARTKTLINISDCYTTKEYDFSGAREYDRLNHYLTKSVIVVPLIDEHDDVIGVLQLINAIRNNEIVPFEKRDENVLTAIANQAGMAIVNSLYSQKIDDLLYGFVKVMSVGVDERSHYNANHTMNMVKYAENFLDYENQTNGQYKVDPLKKREILMAIWLHDIGKILTPLEVLDKDSRLGKEVINVINRFERRDLLLRLELANLKITKEQYEELEKERKKQFDLINLINKVGFLSDELKKQLDTLYQQTYIELDGQATPVLTEREYYQLNIVKGTLNKEERDIVQGHVSMTQKFLSQLNFPKYYDNIPDYAGNHHEFLNGSGYPNHLTKENLSWPCRLITICDIFEALTAKDRPYKKSFTREEAIKILLDMADKGQLDKEIIDEFTLSLSKLSD